MSHQKALEWPLPPRHPHHGPPPWPIAHGRPSHHLRLRAGAKGRAGRSPRTWWGAALAGGSTLVGRRKQMAFRCFMASLLAESRRSKRYTSFCRISDCVYTMLTIPVCGREATGPIKPGLGPRRAARPSIAPYPGPAPPLTVSRSMRSTFMPGPLSSIILDTYCLTASTAFIPAPLRSPQLDPPPRPPPARLGVVVRQRQGPPGGARRRTTTPSVPRGRPRPHPPGARWGRGPQARGSGGVPWGGDSAPASPGPLGESREPPGPAASPAAGGVHELRKGGGNVLGGRKQFEMKPASSPRPAPGTKPTSCPLYQGTQPASPPLAAPGSKPASPPSPHQHPTAPPPNPRAPNPGLPSPPQAPSCAVGNGRRSLVPPFSTLAVSLVFQQTEGKKKKKALKFHFDIVHTTVMRAIPSSPV